MWCKTEMGKIVGICFQYSLQNTFFGGNTSLATGRVGKFKCVIFKDILVIVSIALDWNLLMLQDIIDNNSILRRRRPKTGTKRSQTGGRATACSSWGTLTQNCISPAGVAMGMSSNVVNTPVSLMGTSWQLAISSQNMLTCSLVIQYWLSYWFGVATQQTINWTAVNRSLIIPYGITKAHWVNASLHLIIISWSRSRGIYVCSKERMSQAVCQPIEWDTDSTLI